MREPNRFGYFFRGKRYLPIASLEIFRGCFRGAELNKGALALQGVIGVERTVAIFRGTTPWQRFEGDTELGGNVLACRMVGDPS